MMNQTWRLMRTPCNKSANIISPELVAGIKGLRIDSDANA